ncbi:MAG: hypothetical protein ACREJB_08955, partial [Planctomycetaceae bacterium]
MNDLLQSRLARLRSRVRQLLCLYGLSWIVAVVLSATLAAGVLDWLFHFDDPNVRLVLGLGILAGGALVAWRCLIAPLWRPFSDLELARRIERRYPTFNDSLSSTVEFLEHDADPRFGSPELQRRVIAQAQGQAEGIEPGDVIETRSVRRVATAAIVVCVLAAVTVGVGQSNAAIALERLLFPYSAGAWPRSTHLRLLTEEFELFQTSATEPMRVAAGETIRLYVENARGELPDDVRMQYRIGEEAIVTEPLQAATVKDGEGRERRVA